MRSRTRAYSRAIRDPPQSAELAAACSDFSVNHGLQEHVGDVAEREALEHDPLAGVPSLLVLRCECVAQLVLFVIALVVDDRACLLSGLVERAPDDAAHVPEAGVVPDLILVHRNVEIGRASCRERVEMSGGRGCQTRAWR